MNIRFDTGMYSTIRDLCRDRVLTNSMLYLTFDRYYINKIRFYVWTIYAYFYYLDQW